MGNEEQLLNSKRKGALVDLRCGPHQVVAVKDSSGSFSPFRQQGEELNQERAFADVGNFLCDPDGKEIPGNLGESWPNKEDILWPDP